MFLVSFQSFANVYWLELREKEVKRKLKSLSPLDPQSIASKDLRDKKELTFAVIGDFGMGNKNHYKMATVLAEVCKKRECDFIITVGDNIYGSGIQGSDSPQLKSKFEKPFKDLGKIDFWLSMGNHDWDGEIAPAVEYSLKGPRWRFPNIHYQVPLLPDWLTLYAFDYYDLSNQKKPMMDTLCKKEGWKLIYNHHPMYSHGNHGSSLVMRYYIKPVIKKCDVDMILSGHDHHLEHIQVGGNDGFDQIISGSFSSHRSVWDPHRRNHRRSGPHQIPRRGYIQEFASTKHGFGIVKVSKEKLTFSFYGLKGKKLYKFKRTK